MATWVVTGANRGIGLEFARQLSERGDEVIATARRPESARELAALSVRVEALDVSDAGSIAKLARRVQQVSVDVLVNNAGIGGAGGGLEKLTKEELERVFAVNAIGPVLVTQALLRNLRRGKEKRVVNLTSGLGSISQNESGGWYAYRAAKAALNQLTRTMAAELRSEGFVCIVISPGWVRTDMGGPEAEITPEQSVVGMLRVIDRLSGSDNGKFLSHRGHEIPW